MTLSPRLLLHFRRVKQRRDDGRRADAHGYTRFHQLGASLLAGLVEIVVAVTHAPFPMAFEAPLKAA